MGECGAFKKYKPIENQLNYNYNITYFISCNQKFLKFELDLQQKKIFAAIFL